MHLAKGARAEQPAEDVALVQQPEFEKATAAALGVAQSEWRERMGAELGRAVDVWLDDAIQLTAAAADF